MFFDVQDKKKGSFPEQELTEEQFFEQFAALEEGLALFKFTARLVRKRQTLRQSRQAYAAIDLSCNTLAKVERNADADMRT